MLVLAAYALPAHPRELPPPWIPYDGASTWETARSAGLPVLLYFHAPACRFCEMMKIVLADPAVNQAVIRSFLPVSVDADASLLGSRYAVQGVPAFVVTTVPGEPVLMAAGYMGPHRFLEFLADARETHGVLTDGLRAAETAASSSNPDDGAWDGFRRAWLHPVTRPAVIELVLASPSPPLARIVHALSSPRLSERVAAIDLLTRLAGQDMEYDPWKPSENAEALRRWLRWAEHAADMGVPQAIFRNVTETEALSAIMRLADENRRVVAAARSTLLAAGTAALPLIRRALSDQVLPPQTRAVLQELRYEILAPRSAPQAPPEIGRVLAAGAEEERLRIIAALPDARSDALPLLEELLASPSVPLREAACVAISAIPGPASSAILVDALRTEKDVNACTTIIKELGRRSDISTLDVLLQALDGNEENKVAAIEAVGAMYRKLAMIQKGLAVSAIVGLLNDPSWRVRAAVLAAAEENSIDGVAAAAAALTDDPDPLVRVAALRLVGKNSPAKVSAVLVDMFRRGGDERNLAIEVLAGSNIDVPAEIMKTLLAADSLEMLDCVKTLSSRSLLALDFVNSGGSDAAAAALELLPLDEMKKVDARVLLRMLHSAGVSLRRLAAALVINRCRDDAAVKIYSQAAASDDVHLRIVGLSGLLVSASAPSRRLPALQNLASALNSLSPHDVGDAFKPAAAAIVSLLNVFGRDEMKILGAISSELAQKIVAYALYDYEHLAKSVPLVLAGIHNGAFPPLPSAAILADRIYDVDILNAASERLLDMASSSDPRMRCAALVIALKGVKDYFARSAPGPAARGKRDDWLHKLLAALPSDDTPLAAMLVMLLKASLSSPEALDLASQAAASGDPELRRAAAHVLSWGVPYQYEIRLDAAGHKEVSVGVYRFEPAAGAPLERKHKLALLALRSDPDPSVRIEALIGLLRYGETRSDYLPLAQLLAGDAVAWNVRTRIEQALRESRGNVPTVFLDPLIRMAASAEDYTRRRASEISAKLSPEDRAAYGEALAALTPPQASGSPGRSPKTAFLPDRPRSAVPLHPVQPPASPGKSTAVAFFYQKGCRECRIAKDLLSSLGSRYGRLEIRQYDLAEVSSMRFNEALCERSGVPQNKRLLAPSVFTAAGALVSDDVKIGPLAELIVASAGLPAPWDAVSADEQLDAARSISE
ncbi:MAG TPA: hypothetical protein ENN09_04580, partial [Planctomycetes bacterium]|nr:hypothetical protein [Planctomycetota bacterium]